MEIVILTQIVGNEVLTIVYNKSSPEWEQVQALISLSEKLRQMQESLDESTEELPKDS